MLIEQVNQMTWEIREIRYEEYEAALEIWHSTGDMAAAMIESPEALLKYLKPNHGLSLVALMGGKVVGVILCGHDNGQGQRYQLAVTKSEYSESISIDLLGKALQRLHGRGLRSCKLSLPGQTDSKPFWSAVNWFDKIHANDNQPIPQASQ